jgi:cysteine desulfurase
MGMGEIMIYLDYSATTPVNKDVLDSFNKACTNFIGNPNSLHKLGTDARELISSATKQISDILKVKETEIIYTSCASESNNLAIKGIALKYKNRGNHIITTSLEHSSVYGPLNFLQEQGFEVDFVNIDDNGLIDIDHLKSLIKDTTILVTINSVNSELGILQPIEQIGELLKQYPKCFFHVDMTQNIGKVDVPLTNIDLASLDAHKFYGLKGIGLLVKKEKIAVDPLIHGGKSTTVFRSGTPALALIVSMAKALRLVSENIDVNYNKVLELNKYIKQELLKFEGVAINSNEYCIPHILNFSVMGIKPETFLHALEEFDIYISTQSACSSEKSLSKSVLALTKDEKRASSSLRISLSYLTTKEELDTFLKYFEVCYNNLRLK